METAGILEVGKLRVGRRHLPMIPFCPGLSVGYGTLRERLSTNLKHQVYFGMTPIDEAEGQSLGTWPSTIPDN